MDQGAGVVVALALGAAWTAVIGRHRLGAGWVLALAGVTVTGGTFVGRALGGATPVPSTHGSELGFTVGYVLVLAGVCRLAWVQPVAMRVGVVLGLEVIAAVCGTATLLWEVVERGLGSPGGGDRSVAFTYMLADVAIGIVLLHLLLATGRARSFGWFFAMFVVVWVGDIGFLAGGPAALSVGLYATGYVAFAVAIRTRPSASGRPAATDAARDAARMWMLVPALTGLPVAMVVSALTARPVPAEAAVLGVTGAVASILRLVLRLRDEQARAGQFADLAMHDPLTGLPNRRHLHARLESLADAVVPAGLLFIDLDHFKAVNDAHGHDCGDRVLEITAQRVRRCVRENDLVARYAGDEFVVVAAGIDLPAAQVLARRIADALSAPITVPGATVTIGASVGTVMIDHTRPVEACLAEADQSMYELKRLRAS